MAIFGVLMDDKETANNFIEATKERLRKGNLATNPFTACIKTITQIEREKDIAVQKKLHIIDIEPIYFNYPLLGAFTSLVLLVVSYWALIPLAVFLFFSLFWSGHFYYLIFKLGLKKAGYKGKIVRVSLKEVVRRLV